MLDCHSLSETSSENDHRRIEKKTSPERNDDEKEGTEEEEKGGSHGKEMELDRADDLAMINSSPGDELRPSTCFVWLPSMMQKKLALGQILSIATLIVTESRS